MVVVYLRTLVCVSPRLYLLTTLFYRTARLPERRPATAISGCTRFTRFSLRLVHLLGYSSGLPPPRAALGQVAVCFLPGLRSRFIGFSLRTSVTVLFCTVPCCLYVVRFYRVQFHAFALRSFAVPWFALRTHGLHLRVHRVPAFTSPAVCCTFTVAFLHLSHHVYAVRVRFFGSPHGCLHFICHVYLVARFGSEPPRLHILPFTPTFVTYTTRGCVTQFVRFCVAFHIRVYHTTHMDCAVGYTSPRSRFHCLPFLRFLPGLGSGLILRLPLRTRHARFVAHVAFTFDTRTMVHAPFVWLLPSFISYASHTTVCRLVPVCVAALPGLPRSRAGLVGFPRLYFTRTHVFAARWLPRTFTPHLRAILPRVQFGLPSFASFMAVRFAVLRLRFTLTVTSAWTFSFTSWFGSAVYAHTSPHLTFTLRVYRTHAVCGSFCAFHISPRYRFTCMVALPLVTFSPHAHTRLLAVYTVCGLQQQVHVPFAFHLDTYFATSHSSLLRFSHTVLAVLSPTRALVIVFLTH